MHSNGSPRSSFRCVACNLFFVNFDEQRKHYFDRHSRTFQPQMYTYDVDNNTGNKDSRRYMKNFSTSATKLEPTTTNVTPFYNPVVTSSRPFDKNPLLLTSSLNSPVNSTVKAVKKPVLLKRCEVCNITCTSEGVYNVHIKGKKHLKAVAKEETKGDETLSTTAINETPSVGETLTVDVKAKCDHEILNSGDLENIVGNCCKICNYYSSDINQVYAHIASPKHKRRASESPIKPEVTVQSVVNSQQQAVLDTCYCKICDVSCVCELQLRQHKDGQRHKKMEKMVGYIELVEKKDPSIYCDVCNLTLPKEMMDNHKSGNKHKRKCTRNDAEAPPDKKPKTDDTYCGFCDETLANHQEAVEHYQSEKHSLTMINQQKVPEIKIWCDTCKKNFNSQVAFDSHLKGFKHYSILNRGNPNPQGELAPKLIKHREMSNVRFRGRIRRQPFGGYRGSRRGMFGGPSQNPIAPPFFQHHYPLPPPPPPPLVDY